MPTTVLEILDEARNVYLNDSGSELFTNSVLIPFAKRAYDELQNKLALNGHQIGEEVSATIDVPANTLIMPSLPSDLIEPIKLYERADGSVLENDWVLMTKERILEIGDPQNTLAVWDWRENEIKFRGCTTAREVKLIYAKFQASIVDPNTSLPVINCKPFLSARVAALAAGHIGGNAERAAYIQLDVVAALNDMLGISIKADQSTPVRRQPFRGRR